REQHEGHHDQKRRLPSHSTHCLSAYVRGSCEVRIERLAREGRRAMLRSNAMAASLDAVTLRRGMELFAQSLTKHRDELNSLNVFPVPDGDTGTNLVLTQRAVEAAVASLDGS